MKALLIILLLFCHIASAAEERNYGPEIELGHGFTYRSYTVKNPEGHWEGLAHRSATFYKGKELGMLDGFSISPKANYAIYTKSRDGRLYIFNLKEEKEMKVLSDEYCYPSKHVWDEASHTVTLSCFKDSKTSYVTTIDLKTGKAQKR